MKTKEEGEQRHLMQEILPIIAQEDPYMIACLVNKIILTL
jgi:hypothetical protein